MPHLGKYSYLLDIAFFLYDSVEDARAGVNSGGTGFFVGYKIPDHDRAHAYAVTNWHVACRGSSVIRVNNLDGSHDIFPFDPSEWFFRPNFHDIAVLPIQLDGRVHKATTLNARSYPVTKEMVAAGDVGPGDDVFMVGRFIDYDGVEVNQPSLRFGNISIMSAPIKQENGYIGESIVLDMHSRTGYSGSPVFVYRIGGFVESGHVSKGHSLKLLGIHWGQFPEMWQLEEAKKDKEAAEEASLIVEGRYVRGLSGMTCVCPAWAIVDLLQSESLRERRAMVEAELDKQRGQKGLPASGESAPQSKSPTKDDNPRHKEDFNSLLDAAVRGPKSGGQT